MNWSETLDSKEWDDFVFANNGSVFHSWSWRRVLETTGSRPFYVACRDTNGRILAICPFLQRKAARNFVLLDSLPLSHMSGPLVGSQVANVQEILGLLRKSVKFSIHNPVVCMQLKVHQQPIIRSLIDLGFRHQITEGLFILDLSGKKPADIWSQNFQKHDRQAVKYYERDGSGFGFAQQESDYADYLSLHQESILRRKERQLIPPEFLSKMRADLRDQLKVVLVTFESDVIAGLSMICDPRISTVHLAIIGYSRARNIHSPVVYMDWKIVNWALENGYRYVNFGPTSSSPTNPIHRLKLRFGGRFVPRHEFILPTSHLPYTLARSINWRVRSFQDFFFKPRSL
jgi:hypothetical protein